jgi:hypothetical protein
MSQTGLNVYTLCDGAITAMRPYVNREAALEELGLALD